MDALTGFFALRLWDGFSQWQIAAGGGRQGHGLVVVVPSPIAPDWGVCEWGAGMQWLPLVASPKCCTINYWRPLPLPCSNKCFIKLSSVTMPSVSCGDPIQWQRRELNPHLCDAARPALNHMYHPDHRLR